MKTSFQAIILVVLVILVFLRGWRPSLIAILAMPVSLVGTFAVMSILHLSINYLTMFGLVLAVGIVVDDAIVVVENTARHIEAGKTPKEAAISTMQEVGGALFGIALTLCAVFVPTAFVPGLSGVFFRHFGITIAAATAISCFCSLTLSPALAYLILRQPTSVEEAQRGRMGWLHCFFVRAGNRFEAGFRHLADFYGHMVGKLIEITPMMLGVYGLLIAATLYMLSTTQQGFIPAQDRGYLIVVIQLPGGAAFERTEQVAHVVEKIALSTPGVKSGARFHWPVRGDPDSGAECGDRVCGLDALQHSLKEGAILGLDRGAATAEIGSRPRCCIRGGGPTAGTRPGQHERLLFEA